MQIHVPADAEQWLKVQAARAGFDDVQAYALSILLPKKNDVSLDAAHGRSFYEAAEATGLIGGGSDYAPDLSSNPRHLEGFGR